VTDVGRQNYLKEHASTYTNVIHKARRHTMQRPSRHSGQGPDPGFESPRKHAVDDMRMQPRRGPGLVLHRVSQMSPRHSLKQQTFKKETKAKQPDKTDHTATKKQSSKSQRPPRSHSSLSAHTFDSSESLSVTSHSVHGRSFHGGKGRGKVILCIHASFMGE